MILDDNSTSLVQEKDHLATKSLNFQYTN